MASQRSMDDLSQLSDEEIEDVTQMSHEISQALYEHDKRQVFGVTEQESKLSETEGQQNQSEHENYKNTVSEDEIPIQSQSQQSERTWRGKNSKKRFEMIESEQPT